MMKYMILFIQILLFACPMIGFGKDLGTVGATYQIVERDALEEIENRAKKVDWGKLFDKDKNEQRIKNYRPNSLVALPRAKERRVRFVDLSYTLDVDIPDANGNILYPKGFTFNPLDYIVYPRTIIIINGSDRKQVEWFKKSQYVKGLDTVLWIVDGSYYDLGKELGRSVFYANSAIVERLQLLAVPSIVVQKDNLFEVTEIDVEFHAKK